MGEPQNISVIVPTINRGETLRETLMAIINNKPAPTEIIIIDQSKPALQQIACETVEATAKDAGWSYSIEIHNEPAATPGKIRLIQCPFKGAGRARNAGARLAKSEIVAFTDDDTIVHKHWVASMLSEFEEPKIWGVYGQILPYHENDGAEVIRNNENRQLFVEPIYPWYLGSGANMAFRRNCLIDVAAGMDEILSIGDKFHGFEDIDIGYRMLMMGGHILYTPTSLVYHNSQKSFAEQLRTETGYGISVGAATAKYWRCGDPLALKILGGWLWQMGIRRMGAGLLKWRSLKVMRLALLQFWWPLVGVYRASKQPIDRLHWLYLPHNQ